MNNFYGELISLSPAEVKFSQDSVAMCFQDPPNEINETLKEIAKDSLSVSSFPLIRVLVIDGDHYSVDNRRLYVFRVLNLLGLLQSIQVKKVNSFERDFTNKNKGCHVWVRSGKDNNGRKLKVDTYRHCSCIRERNARLPEWWNENQKCLRSSEEPIRSIPLPLMPKEENSESSSLTPKKLRKTPSEQRHQDNTKRTTTSGQHQANNDLRTTPNEQQPQDNSKRTTTSGHHQTNNDLRTIPNEQRLQDNTKRTTTSGQHQTNNDLRKTPNEQRPKDNNKRSPVELWTTPRESIITTKEYVLISRTWNNDVDTGMVYEQYRYQYRSSGIGSHEEFCSVSLRKGFVTRGEASSGIPDKKFFPKLFYSKKVWLFVGVVCLIFLLKNGRWKMMILSNGMDDKEHLESTISKTRDVSIIEGIKLSLCSGLNNLKSFASNGTGYLRKLLDPMFSKTMSNLSSRLPSSSDLNDLKDVVSSGVGYVKEQSGAIISENLPDLSSKLPTSSDLSDLKDVVSSGVGYVREQTGTIISENLPDLSSKLPSSNDLSDLKDVVSSGLGYVKEQSGAIISENLPDLSSKLPSSSDLSNLKDVVSSGLGYVKEQSGAIISENLPDLSSKLPSSSDLSNLKDVVSSGLGYVKEQSGAIISENLPDLSSKLPTSNDLSDLKDVVSSGLGYVKEQSGAIISENLPDLSSKLPTSNDLSDLKDVVSSGLGYVKEQSESFVSETLPNLSSKLPTSNDLSDLNDFLWNGWRKN